LFDDSTCYLKGYFFDNSIYFIYKGQLKQKNDTLHEFHFQPIINLGCNKRLHLGDSVRFYINQIDTTISLLTYKVQVESDSWQEIILNGQTTTVYLKGVNKFNFSIDTKFSDPLTGKNIFMTVHPTSDPELNYFGSKTDYNTLTLSIVKNKLTIYPDRKYIQDKDTMTLKK
jgi:hypothetical protein